MSYLFDSVRIIAAAFSVRNTLNQRSTDFMSRYERCACHSKAPYHKCCQRYHDGVEPENALVLMRSRYCAYAKHIFDYIISTTHPDNPDYNVDHNTWRYELQRYVADTRFDSLKIREFLDGEATAFVSFTVSLRQNNQDISFTERSEFVKDSGRWFYKSGEVSTEG
jgi:SEC-C motif domain protein